MKLLFDLFPIILFFVVEPMQWASLGIIVVFGGMTLLFHDETFIKWKPTVLYGLFAAALLLTQPLTGKQPLKAMMGGQLDLPEPVWSRLTLAWVAFFVAMAALNLLVAYRFSLDAWVNFKLFGSLGLTFAFVLLQGLWLSRHLKEPLGTESRRQDGS